MVVSQSLHSARLPLPETLPDVLVDRPMSPPCFVEDTQLEVEHYFMMLANSHGAAVYGESFWQRLPMYAQYIQEHSVEEVLQHSVDGLRAVRAEKLHVEEAAKMPASLGYMTTLPVAVACHFLHKGCGGLPGLFVYDLFQLHV